MLRCSTLKDKLHLGERTLEPNLFREEHSVQNEFKVREGSPYKGTKRQRLAQGWWLPLVEGKSLNVLCRLIGIKEFIWNNNRDGKKFLPLLVKWSEPNEVERIFMRNVWWNNFQWKQIRRRTSVNISWILVGPGRITFSNIRLKFSKLNNFIFRWKMLVLVQTRGQSHSRLV